jgi:hypothetical protein
MKHAPKILNLYRIALILLVILLTLMIIKLFGLNLNKNYINEVLNFDQQQCIEQEYSTFYHHSGIAGCIFWMRSDYLEKSENWASLFERDETYCSQKYDSNVSKLSLSLEELHDPKCEYSAFKNAKIEENWSFLISTEKDGMYNYCVDQICSNPKIFE